MTKLCADWTTIPACNILNIFHVCSTVILRHLVPVLWNTALAFFNGVTLVVKK